MIMCLSISPSFAGAEVKKVPILDGKKGYTSLDFNEVFKFRGKEIIVSPSMNFIFDVGRGKTPPIYFDLGREFNLRAVRMTVADGDKLSVYKPDASFKFYDASKRDVGNSYLRMDTGGSSSKMIAANKVRYVKFEYKSLLEGSYDNTVFSIGIDAIEGLEDIFNLNAVEGLNDVNFTWDSPTMDGFTGVKIYKDGSLVATVDKHARSYKVDGLEANKNYNIKFVSVYEEGESVGVQKGVKTLVDPKAIPPNSVSSLTAEPTYNTVKLKWKSPKDDDLAGFKILQNGKQIAEIGLEEEFTVKNLKPLTEYTFGVIAVDRDKNDSSPVNLSVKTLEEKDDEPPLVPSNVFAKPSNGALIVSWDKVSDKDLAGYNVYVDGKKINSNLISSTNFTIKNLENNRKYKVQVQAVDRSGNASELSLSVYGTPDENTIPIIESKYSLQDVSDGVSAMFGQFWTVLAFSVGIPLAFYIIYKLKHTVLP